MNNPSPKIVVFDTETTGLSAEEDRLVELAGVCLDYASPDFTSLVNPERDIPAEARAIHHIGPDDIVNAPVEKEAFSAFKRHFVPADNVTPLVLAAHNAKFDRGFVERIDPGIAPFYICTYKCSVVVWPDAPAHGNQVLRYYLGLDVDAELPADLFPHRALYDCIVTRALLKELLKHKTLRELVQISNNPILLNKVSFGKHKGKLWSEVDYGYLRWCVGQSDMNEDVLHTAHHYLNANSKFGKGRR